MHGMSSIILPKRSYRLILKSSIALLKVVYLRKSLNIALAGTGVGKSLFMCHCAAGALTDGKNVLYLTMEMSEERIAERIDANLFNVAIDQLENSVEENVR